VKKTVKDGPVAEKKTVAPIPDPAKTVTPVQKVTIVPPTPPVAQAPSVQLPKPQVSETSSGKVKSNSGNGNVTVSLSTNGKYDPGTINDQTAQRLARLLVSEIKLYYKSKTEGDAASEVKNVYDMLKDPIDKSRQHYKQRMGPTAIKTMPDYFHGELVRSLCDGDPSRLGPNYPVMDERT